MRHRTSIGNYPALRYTQEGRLLWRLRFGYWVGKMSPKLRDGNLPHYVVITDSGDTVLIVRDTHTKMRVGMWNRYNVSHRTDLPKLLQYIILEGNYEQG